MNPTPTRSARALLAMGTLFIIAATAPAGAQVNSRKMTSAEQAFVDKLAAEFAKVLPAVPAGWAEVERRVYDSGGMTSDWDSPIQADYELQLVSKDLEAKQKIVEARQQALADRDRQAFDAATAKTEKAMTEFSAKLEAAMAKKDMALVDRLQAEFQKTMADGAKPPQIAAAPELSDTYARIRIMFNPYSAPVMAEKAQPVPAGFTFVGRREPDANNSEREGVTRYVLGKYVPDDGGSGHTLKFTPKNGAVVYGIVVEIEARADRATALFKAMDIGRLQALLR